MSDTSRGPTVTQNDTRKGLRPSCLRRAAPDCCRNLTRNDARLGGGPAHGGLESLSHAGAESSRTFPAWSFAGARIARMAPDQRRNRARFLHRVWRRELRKVFGFRYVVLWKLPCSRSVCSGQGVPERRVPVVRIRHGVSAMRHRSDTKIQPSDRTRQLSHILDGSLEPANSGALFGTVGQPATVPKWRKVAGESGHNGTGSGHRASVQSAHGGIYRYEWEQGVLIGQRRT